MFILFCLLLPQVAYQDLLKKGKPLGGKKFIGEIPAGQYKIEAFFHSKNGKGYLWAKMVNVETGDDYYVPALDAAKAGLVNNDNGTCTPKAGVVATLSREDGEEAKITSVNAAIKQPENTAIGGSF